MFNDLDLSTIRNGTEPGISGVRVDLYDSTGTTLITSVITGAGGAYSFSNLPAGDYVVIETDLAGYVSTTPNSVPTTVSGGGSATVNFGDYRLSNTTLSTITGTVYNDANGNGTLDPGEVLLSGVTVELKNNAGQSLLPLRRIHQVAIVSQTFLLVPILLLKQIFLDISAPRSIMSQ